MSFLALVVRPQHVELLSCNSKTNGKKQNGSLKQEYLVGLQKETGERRKNVTHSQRLMFKDSIQYEASER